MPAIWMVMVVALWIAVLVETGLLLALLRSLGQLRRLGILANQDHLAPLPPTNGGLMPGEAAPDFAAVDPDGRKIALSDFAGKRRLLAFVSPGCSVCTSLIQALNEAIRDGTDLDVLVIGTGDREVNRGYGQEQRAQMPILASLSESISDLYQVRSMPYVFALDEEGVVRGAGIVNRREHLQGLLVNAFPTRAPALS